ncbi:MAG: phosphotransferase [Candidatus Heimdallarchaeota archaeon]
MILEDTIVRTIIKKYYNLGKITSINPLESGHESDNVKFSTDKGEYVIKYFSQEPGSVREKVFLQQLLFLKGVKLPEPIQTITDDFVVEHSPKETITIQSFIPGEAIVFRDKDPEKMYKLMSWFGKHLGEFHFLSKSIDESEIRQRIKREDYYDRTSGLLWVKEQYSKRDTILPPHEKNEMIIKEFEIYLEEVEEIFSSNLTIGVVHTDLKPGDFFVQNNELSGILDFNGAFYSYLINELGTWIMYTSLYKPEIKKHFQNFIKPYLEHSKIPENELKFIPMFLKGRAFVQYFYFAYRNYNKITQGLDDGETNIQGFEDGISLVESSLEIQNSYFYNLALQVLAKSK